VSWVLGAGGWAFGLVLALTVRARASLLADAEHELRGAVTAIGLAAERMQRAGATRAFASLVALQLDRMDAAMVDLGRASRPWWKRRPRSRALSRPSEPRIDVGRLSQVVSNLVDNAAEHGAGPVEVRWSATGKGARLEIRNGNRPPELDDPAGERRPGRGRGLGIAGRAARELGGSLRVDSDDAVTAATLELPVAADRGRSHAA
jgi:C4-dicarboxylate-specific signal transduction histidine kinase